MTAAWQIFVDELERWRDAGRSADFWWRDDDATLPTEALGRLITLSHDTATPLALAVIPADVDASLPALLRPSVTVLQHGVAHLNGAAAGEKKSEFPAGQPVDVLLGRLDSGRQRLAQLFGGYALPVLVPPWNRISAPGLVERLSGAGYRGLSRFGARSVGAGTSALVQINTRVYVIDWKGSRGFAGEAAALAQAVRHLQARRTGTADAGEPTGWLSHHAVHDAATWSFLEQLMAATTRAGNVVWRSAPELFAPT